MIIDCISDLHGHLPELEGGDLLIIAGDLTARDSRECWTKFYNWMNKQKYKKIVLIAGNHDGALVGLIPSSAPKSKVDFEYLCDSGTVFYEPMKKDHTGELRRFKIWGSPWTPEFCGWDFMKKRGKELKEVWDKIPDDTDILITHGPPQMVLDHVVEVHDGGTVITEYTGCGQLRLALERVKPKLHVFGHIHEHGGKTLLFKHEGPNTICVNASIMDRNYRPVNKPVRIIL